MSEFKRETRYAVIKLKHLTEEGRKELNAFMEKHQIPDMACVVVESDWPEYDPVWQMIQARVQGQKQEEDWALPKQGPAP